MFIFFFIKRDSYLQCALCCLALRTHLYTVMQKVCAMQCNAMRCNAMQWTFIMCESNIMTLNISIACLKVSNGSNYIILFVIASVTIMI